MADCSKGQRSIGVQVAMALTLSFALWATIVIAALF